MDMDLFQPDDIPLQEGERTLVCSCPKCSARIEQDLTQLTEESNPANCPACKARFVLTRESFARRASRKAGEISCAICGGELDHSQFCPSCKALYPDYFATELPDAAKKRARRKRDLFGGLKNFSFEWRTASAPSVEYHPVLADSEPWQESVSHWNKKYIFTGLIAAAMVAVIALGFGFYSHYKLKNEYTESYVMALYGIKTGTDLGLKACGRISAEWTAKGQSTPPPISVDDENTLNNIKIETDKYLQKLSDPPSSFTDSKARIVKLHELYSKLHTAAVKPSGTVTGYVTVTQKTESEYRAAAADLKKNLPPEISAELEIVKAKYRTMSDF